MRYRAKRNNNLNILISSGEDATKGKRKDKNKTDEWQTPIYLFRCNLLPNQPTNPYSIPHSSTHSPIPPKTTRPNPPPRIHNPGRHHLQTRGRPLPSPIRHAAAAAPLPSTTTMPTATAVPMATTSSMTPSNTPTRPMLLMHNLHIHRLPPAHKLIPAIELDLNRTAHLQRADRRPNAPLAPENPILQALPRRILEQPPKIPRRQLRHERQTGAGHILIQQKPPNPRGQQPQAIQLIQAVLHLEHHQPQNRHAEAPLPVLARVGVVQVGAQERREVGPRLRDDEVVDVEELGDAVERALAVVGGLRVLRVRPGAEGGFLRRRPGDDAAVFVFAEEDDGVGGGRGRGVGGDGGGPDELCLDWWLAKGNWSKDI